MTTEKALSTLADAFNEKARERAVEALEELRIEVSEAEHDRQEIRAAQEELANADSTLVGYSLPAGIQQLRKMQAETTKELQMVRTLYLRSDAVIVACKVALVDSITADHRWHRPEENCPHARCIALNQIEALRGDG